MSRGAHKHTISKRDSFNGSQCNYWEVMILDYAYGNNILFSLLSNIHAQMFVWVAMNTPQVAMQPCKFEI